MAAPLLPFCNLQSSVLTLNDISFLCCYQLCLSMHVKYSACIDGIDVIKISVVNCTDETKISSRGSWNWRKGVNEINERHMVHVSHFIYNPKHSWLFNHIKNCLGWYTTLWKYKIINLMKKKLGGSGREKGKKNKKEIKRK